MSDVGQGKAYKIALYLLVILILYNIGSGLIVKKMGIPGIFEIEFEDKSTPQSQPEVEHQTEKEPDQTQPQQKQPETPTRTETEPQQPASWQFVQPPALPESTCPRVSGMFWLQYPNIWYGPFYGYYLAWDRAGGFYAWDPYLVSSIPYPDPYRQVQRNTWLRLYNSPFNICVESSTGNVFGQYYPY
jgi:hypothetical protein